MALQVLLQSTCRPCPANRKAQLADSSRFLDRYADVEVEGAYADGYVVLAGCSAVVQPRAGRALDDGRLTPRSGLAVGLSVTAVGLACATLPGLTGVVVCAALVGSGTGLITPLGFAALAGGAPAERLGQTMGAAELGRELGDAGGPLLVAAVASSTTLSYGFAALAVPTGAGAVLAWLHRRPTPAVNRSETER